VASGFRRLSLSTLLILLLLNTSCSAKTEGQQKFGADSDYFIGLKMLSQGNEKDARTKFNRVIKKGSYYCAKKSAEALCTFGTIQEKNQAALDLINLYPEKDSLLIAAKQLEQSEEINKLIEITENLDFSKDKNELIKMRLEALKKRNASSYEKEVYQWFTSCPISKEHYQFFRDTYNYSEEEHTPQQFAINYRIELYKRNYSYTFPYAMQLIEYFNTRDLEPNEQLASDIGKSYLYGSMEFVKNAAGFKQLAENYKDTCMEFYFYFYAGRLYEKAGIYYKQTKQAFENAMNAAQTPDQKDNALWYLLNTSLNFSVDTIIESIGTYSRQWNNPEYFDDFFEALISSLLASGRWNAFYNIYTQVDGFASDETTARFAYLYGRLVEEGLAEGTEESKKSAFIRALNSDSSVYYKALAAYRLNLKEEGLDQILSQPNIYDKWYTKPQETPAEDKAIKIKAATVLLEGYAYFGFPELIYPTWQEFDQRDIPAETSFYLAEFLQKIAGKDGSDDYYTQSLRIASRGQKYAKNQLTKDQIRLVYPKDYADFIETYCKKYDIKESVIYALIRSESFFDADVTSSAGAIGLTQLMEFTGSDVAKRLKITDYELTDPEISINFGTYYLSELVRRCDGSLLQGFFAYNAGITRVRRWLQSSLIEFGKKKDMPLDLFLETVPYAETREYGRKLISATVMYEWLEYPEDKNSENFYKTVDTLINYQE